MNDPIFYPNASLIVGSLAAILFLIAFSRIMRKETPLIVNFTLESMVSLIFPGAALASSHSLQWDIVGVQHHRQPAWNTPEFYSTQHLVLVNQTPQSVKFEQVVGQRCQQGILNQHDLVIIPAHLPCQASWNQEMEFVLLIVEPSCLEQVVENGFNLEQVAVAPQVAVFDPNMSLVSVLLKSELQSQSLGSDRYVAALCQLLSLTLLRRFSTQEQLAPIAESTQTEGSLKRAIGYINENLADPLSLKQIAAVAKMSPFYFARLFKQATGTTPNQYVTHRRMERAKQVLIEQDLNIAEVSQKVGIQSQSHFNKLFREYTGLTPKAFKDQR
jgi:AraC family transcriptional regulator